MVAAVKGAAICITQEEREFLKRIANSPENSAASKRAEILLASSQGKTYEWQVTNLKASKLVITTVRKQWNTSILSGQEKVNEVCFSKPGKRRNKEELTKKVKRILQLNNQIDPELSVNARSLMIVEIAKRDNFQVSHSTVRRALGNYRKELNL